MECQLTAIIQGYWEVEPLLNGIQLRSFDHQVVSFMVPIFKDFLCSFDCRTALIQSRRPWGYERYYSQSQTLGSTGFKRGIAKLLSLYETIQNIESWVRVSLEHTDEQDQCKPCTCKHFANTGAACPCVESMVLLEYQILHSMAGHSKIYMFSFQRLAASRLLQRLEDWIPLHDLPKLSVLKTEDRVNPFRCWPPISQSSDVWSFMPPASTT